MSDNLKEISKQLPPEKYREILDSIHLIEISLIEVSSTVSRSALLNMEQPKFRIRDSFSVDHAKEFYRLKGAYRVDVPVKGRGKNPLNIEAIYSVRFSGPENIPEGFWIIYKEIVLPIQLWPYFREFVQSLTARMNIPPLTLPVIHQ
ncbi:MAG: hypothetical protein GXO90_05610 [FCB group bacterium]|nr:hypothetical protein [FCB group bacterium]